MQPNKLKTDHGLHGFSQKFTTLRFAYPQPVTGTCFIVPCGDNLREKREIIQYHDMEIGLQITGSKLAGGFGDGDICMIVIFSMLIHAMVGGLAPGSTFRWFPQQQPVLAENVITTSDVSQVHRNS